MKDIDKRVAFIIKNLSDKDRIQFLSELIKLSLSGSNKEILDCILDWEETAEINSMPERRKKILSRYKSITSQLSNKYNA